MSQATQSQMAPPQSEKDGQTLDRGIFNYHEASKHENHHYLRMYGGQVMNAFIWGAGSTLGADVANAAFGEAKEWWRH